MGRSIGVIFGALLILAVTTPAVAAPEAFLSIADSALTPGDTVQLSVAVQNFGPSATVDIYFVLRLPTGTLIFLVLTSGGLVPTQTPAPLVSGVTLSDGLSTGLVPLFAYTFTGSEPQGAYQASFGMTQAGTPNVVDASSVGFSFGAGGGRGPRR